MLPRKSKSGFTLIELVLVLAIAALIILIIFLAFQGAARGRRDNERRNAAARLLAAAETYAGNNNGAYPAVQGTACEDIINNAGYNDGGYPCADSDQPNDSSIRIFVGRVLLSTADNCATDPLPGVVTIKVRLEAGPLYCLDNS